MIRFQGFEPESEIKIEYIGLRPGERLDESLWAKDEEPSETEYSRILRINKKKPLSFDIKNLVEQLRPVCKFDAANPSAYRNAELLKKILKDEAFSLLSA